jgi:cysteine sulfinate desulfinase/cysteine desulfurase-like protein
MNQDQRGHQPVSTVEDLLNLHDESFVHNAYLSVLRRPADPSGFASHLKQLRAGADKEQLIAALATSAEGKFVTDEHLPGLKQTIERAQRNRPPFWLKAVRKVLVQALQPLINQLNASDQRLHALSLITQAKFDRIEAMLLQLESNPSTGSGSAVTPEERQELQHMSEHAREVYFKLKDAVAHQKRVSLQ